MNSYLEIALVNAVMILPLALVAELAGRAFRRPALTHILWVLILVKLVTPPLWQIPIVDRDWLVSSGRHLLPLMLAEADRVETKPHVARTVDESNRAPRSRPRPRSLAETDRRANLRQVSPLVVAATWVRSERCRQLVVTTLHTVWAFGALVWFSIQGFRCIKFRLSLAIGTAAPDELQRHADQLANRLGLARSPTVWLMPGVMSPMLWGTGESTMLIFPEELLDRLDPEATGTLLTHELAHFRRRDHWVRIIALMTTGFYWWHPVVWWARREIEAVEEECCDALVLKAATAPPKRYAEAILETVDFLAELQLRLPPLATGLGKVPFLRQRLTWIMRGPRPQDLGRCGQFLCLTLACTLPLQPTWLVANSPTPLPSPKSNRTPMSGIVTPVLESLPVIIDSGKSSSPDLASKSPSEAQAVPSRWSGFETRSQSSDGRFFVMGNKTSLFLLDMKTGQDFDLSEFAIISMAFCPGSDRFVTVGQDQNLRLWYSESCEVIRTWPIPGGVQKSVDVSVDGQWIATGGRDGVVRIWNEGNSEPIRELPKELAPVNCVRFSAQGELLAVASGDWMTPQSGRIALLNVSDWSERISMNWNSPTAAVAFRSDGQSLTSGDWQGRIARWSISSGELMGMTNGHKNLMAVAEFSPSGSPLAEIDIPNLAPEPIWEEAEPADHVRFFFNPWIRRESGNTFREQNDMTSGTPMAQPTTSSATPSPSTPPSGRASSR